MVCDRMSDVEGRGQSERMGRVKEREKERERREGMRKRGK
jgi:hypothetical protein